MPTEDEFIAITACAIKARNSYGELFETEKQFKLVMEWAGKYMELRKRQRENAKKYMRKRREIDPDYGHYKKKEEK